MVTEKEQRQQGSQIQLQQDDKGVNNKKKISLASTIEIQLQQHATNTRRNACASRKRHD